MNSGDYFWPKGWKNYGNITKEELCSYKFNNKNITELNMLINMSSLCFILFCLWIYHPCEFNCMCPRIALHLQLQTASFNSIANGRDIFYIKSKLIHICINLDLILNSEFFQTNVTLIVQNFILLTKRFTAMEKDIQFSLPHHQIYIQL